MWQHVTIGFIEIYESVQTQIKMYHHILTYSLFAVKEGTWGCEGEYEGNCECEGEYDVECEGVGVWGYEGD